MIAVSHASAYNSIVQHQNSRHAARGPRIRTVDSVMTDHLSWQILDGVALRCVRGADAVWLITCEPTRERTRVRYELLSGTGQPPVWTLFDTRQLVGSSVIAQKLRALKVLARWRNADLWDALATSIIRQVIRAAHARRLYAAMCDAFGTRFATRHGEIALFPEPGAVLALTDADFAHLGLSFKRDALRAAARAYITHGQAWAGLPSHVLVDALTEVYRVGDWTARATVADYSNDFSLYPYGDLAVRTWATAIDANTPWPSTDMAFARAWENVAAADLSAWTVSTLAFGVQYGNRTAPGAGTRTG
jgi:DNA-3-methyladenine glycosylase II